MHGSVPDFEGDGRRVSDSERAHLLMPRPALAGCIAMAIVRDTRGVAMNDAQRVSHFPRSPYCGLSWIKEGEVHEFKGAEGGIERFHLEKQPDISVSGNRQNPTTMWSPGDAYGVTVVFYPDAWQALTGSSIESVSEKTLALDDVVSADLAAIARGAAQKREVGEGFLQLQDGLEPLWRQRRQRDGVTPVWFKDWAVALAMRAATLGAGRSLRQLQRRVKRWTGFAQRDLDQQARVEQLFVRSYEEGIGDLAGLAQEFGYADQAHMGRQVRKITGRSPAKIMDLIETEESYWIYRLIGAHLSAEDVAVSASAARNKPAFSADQAAK